MKKFFCNSAVVAIIASLAGTASADGIKCKYSGNWKETGGNAASSLTWKVEYSGGNNKWTVKGSGSDSFGDSTLDGKCTDTDCTITMVYSSGSAKGETYTWNAKYTEKKKSEKVLATTLSGTWTAKAGGSKGTFSANGDCE
jgi:hypothetical protein